MTGTWSYVAEYPGDDGGRCTAVTTIELSETGEGLIGQVGSLAVTCEDGAAAAGLDATLSNLQLEGDTVAFRYMTFDHTGTLSGDRLEGEAVGGSFEFQAGPSSVRTIEGEGTWTATR